MKHRVTRCGKGDRHEFDWGSITWFHSGDFTGSSEVSLGEVIIKSGCANPAHTHSNCEEVLLLLAGELHHTCGDETSYDLKPGDSICIQAGIPHNATTTSKCAARMIVAYSSAYREMQGE